MVLLILQDGSIEGPLLPLLGGQGNLAAEPPGRKDRSGDLRAGLAGAGAPTCSPTSDSENLSPDELELLAKLEEQNR